MCELDRANAWIIESWCEGTANGTNIARTELNTETLCHAAKKYKWEAVHSTVEPGKPYSQQCSTNLNTYRCCADSDLSLVENTFGGTIHLTWEPPLDLGGTDVT
jgi:hypothetical protein